MLFALRAGERQRAGHRRVGPRAGCDDEHVVGDRLARGGERDARVAIDGCDARAQSTSTDMGDDAVDLEVEGIADVERVRDGEGPVVEIDVRREDLDSGPVRCELRERQQELQRGDTRSHDDDPRSSAIGRVRHLGQVLLVPSVLGDRPDDLGMVEQTLDLGAAAAIGDVGVVEDVGEQASRTVLADHVLCRQFFARRAREEKRQRPGDHGGHLLVTRATDARQGSSIRRVIEERHKVRSGTRPSHRKKIRRGCGDLPISRPQCTSMLCAGQAVTSGWPGAGNPHFRRVFLPMAIAVAASSVR